MQIYVVSLTDSNGIAEPVYATTLLVNAIQKTKLMNEGRNTEYPAFFTQLPLNR